MKRMNIKKYIRPIFAATVTLISGGLLSSCVDDVLQPDSPDHQVQLPDDSYALRFKINLETMTRDGNTTDFEKLEDYIDPNRVHVLFFFGNEHLEDGTTPDPKYNTLIKKFGPEELTLVPVSSTGSNNASEWYVHIPITENNEAFGNILRYNEFKVAVLANWPGDVDLNGYDFGKQEPGDNVHKLHHQPKPNIGDQGEDPYIGEATYNFLFEGKTTMGAYVNWVNSGKSVHQAREFILNEYGPGVNTSSNLNPKDKYDTYRYDELWLRWNFTDAYNYLPEGQRTSVNGQGYNYKVQPNPYDVANSKANAPSEKWALQNYYEFYNWFWKEHERKENDVTVKEWVKIDDETELEDFNFYQYPSIAIEDVNKHQGYFRFNRTDEPLGDSYTKAYIKTNINTSEGKLTGIVLPKVVRKNDYIEKNVIVVKIPNNGELNIKWGSLTKDTEAKIKLERRNHIDDKFAKSETINGYPSGDNVDSTTETYKEFSTYDPSFDNGEDSNGKDKDPGKGNEIKITGDAEYLFIYNEEDNPAVIYEIEYISSYYLHNIDNEGIPLSKVENMLIPMYGIEKYSALGSWKPGTVFDLSNFNNLGQTTVTVTDKEGEEDVEYDMDLQNYPHKTVQLIRSVAKVELKIPKIYQAHHVFLRSMNRRGRCEPVDVSTPTSKIWNKTLAVGEEGKGGHGDECHDWGKIYGHTPFFVEKSKALPNADEYANYRSKLAWYYGNWSNNNIVGKGPDGKGSIEVEINATDKKNDIEDYPQIMNAMIQRTDFTEFIEAGFDGYYDRYVLYVPEKYVDDPGSVGSDKNMETTTPKVCHIEFRGDTDPYTNIDDNWAYRIYFTDGGFYSNDGANEYPDFKKPTEDAKDDTTWENSYEQKEANLENHWPIIRNHYYRFTVIDAMNRMVIAKLEVLPWKMVEENRYEW